MTRMEDRAWEELFGMRMMSAEGGYGEDNKGRLRKWRLCVVIYNAKEGTWQGY